MKDATTNVGVSVDGHQVAAVEVLHEDGSELAMLSFRVDAGHLPPAVRRELVEAVFDLAQLRECHQLQIALPLGDTELLRDLREHCTAINARAAGATCLIDADVEP